jgi:hypothetical protein
MVAWVIFSGLTLTPSLLSNDWCSPDQRLPGINDRQIQ